MFRKTLTTVVAAIVLAGVPVASASAAKGPNKATFERTIAKDLAKDGMIVPDGVTCAMPKTWKKGERFDCKLRGVDGKGYVGTVRVIVESRDGVKLEWEGA